jgi:hypothetical protein
VRLLRPDELAADWDPTKTNASQSGDGPSTVRALETGGEGTAATLAAKLGSKAEIARELAYRLYTPARGRSVLPRPFIQQPCPKLARDHTSGA